MSYRQIFNRYIDSMILDSNKDKTNQAMQHLFGQLTKEEKAFINTLLLEELGKRVAMEKELKL